MTHDSNVYSFIYLAITVSEISDRNIRLLGLFVKVTEIDVGDSTWGNILHHVRKKGGGDYLISFHKN